MAKRLIRSQVAYLFTFPLLRPCTKDAFIVRSFTRKKSRKKINEGVIMRAKLRNSEKIFLDVGAHKILLSLKVESQDLRVVNPI